MRRRHVQKYSIDKQTLMFSPYCHLFWLLAWARIHVGVHFPFDMLGGAIVALLSTIIIIYISPLIYQYVFPLSEQLHKIVFVKLIRKQVN